jgi:hypothetical protein
LVTLIEEQFPRGEFPRVFECLAAIHDAQEESLRQLRGNPLEDHEILRISCAKGGTSVLADACLVRGWLEEAEEQFAFDWGVLLQLGDDLQDVIEDRKHGSQTLFTHRIHHGQQLDAVTRQLLLFSECIATQAEQLPHGSQVLRDLLRQSWRSLIVGAVAEAREFYSKSFVAEMEAWSPVGFAFLHSRKKKMLRRNGLFANVFQAFLEESRNELNHLPCPSMAREKELSMAAFA